MPIYRNIDVQPFDSGHDISIRGTGFQNPPNISHNHTNDALTINYAFNADGLHLDIQLLVPAVQHTDFIT